MMMMTMTIMMMVPFHSTIIVQHIRPLKYRPEQEHLSVTVLMDLLIHRLKHKQDSMDPLLHRRKQDSTDRLIPRLKLASIDPLLLHLKAKQEVDYRIE